MKPIDPIIGARLLRLARAVISAEVTGTSVEDQGGEPWPALERHGAFVTLRKGGHLRGCIGTFSTDAELPVTIAEMARSATRDPRFCGMPITSSELSEIRIELSILSPLSKIDDPLDFEMGVHGLYLRHGSATGCFLPEVGAEQGWDLARLLTELCRQKAHLSPEAWRDAEAEVFVYTTQKIRE